MRTLFIILLLFTVILADAQEKQGSHSYSNQFWLGYYNQVKIKEGMVLSSDIQFRTKDGIKVPGQFLFRSGLRLRLNEKFSLTLGGAHFRYFLSSDLTRGEWRPWQEFEIKDVYKKIEIAQRFRVEERFNQVVKQGELTENYLFNWRFRYKLDVLFPLHTSSSGSLKFTTGNEVMLNAGQNIRYNYFDQNRLSVGLLIDYVPNLTLQPQYIFISQQLADGSGLSQSSVFRFNILQKF